MAVGREGSCGRRLSAGAGASLRSLVLSYPSPVVEPDVRISGNGHAASRDALEG